MFFRDSENGAVDPKLIRWGARPPLRQWWSVLVSPMESGSHRSPLNQWSNLQICCWNHHLSWSTLIWRWKAAASTSIHRTFAGWIAIRVGKAPFVVFERPQRNPITFGLSVKSNFSRQLAKSFPKHRCFNVFFCVKLCQTISRYPISDMELSTIASESSSVGYIYIQSYSDWYYIYIQYYPSGYTYIIHQMVYYKNMYNQIYSIWLYIYI